MINALEFLRNEEFRNRAANLQERQFNSGEEGRGLQNQMLRFQLQQGMENQQRERVRQNMLAQAVASGNPNALMMADPRLGFQMKEMQSREQMAKDRIAAQERIATQRFNQQRIPPGYRFNAQGNLEAIPGGPADPNVAEDAATRKKRGEMAIGLPDVIAKGEQAISQIDQMIGDKSGLIKEHPGFQNAVGMPNIVTGLGARLVPGLFPGSDTASFNKRLDQVRGAAFLQAFETLKGGGQITEIEGRKATDAITRMDNSQSEAEFKKAAREFQDIIRTGIERAKGKPASFTTRQGQSTPSADNDPLGLRGMTR